MIRRVFDHYYYYIQQFLAAPSTSGQSRVPCT
jgi:hypothetical protein